MSALPDTIAQVSAHCFPADVPVPSTGQREFADFERLKAAYDPASMETGARMISAFCRFKDLGYAAYFYGIVEPPELIAARPLIASMWKFGFDLAKFDAATRRCKCDCDKRYVWGKGYGTCPRIPLVTQNK